MNTSPQEGLALAKAVEAKASHGLPQGVELVVAPPFTHLSAVAAVLSKVGLSAQNCATHDSGAYTGEVSASMLKQAGAGYVIIGHSERRSYYGETDQSLSLKMAQLLKNGLTPIFCCGEVLDERESGKHFEVVEAQVANVLFQLSEEDFRKVVIAYEPVWAIGTGRTASPEQAQEMHAAIRGWLRGHFGDSAAADCAILYGGSCKASNAQELFANPDVDGGLIGGASLNADEFWAIANSF